MTTTGQLTAKPPISPHANLTAVERVGTSKSCSAIWRMVCTCGATLTADAQVIRRGLARCETCNPRLDMQQAKKILDVLPAGYDKLERKTKLTYSQLRHRITWMRERSMCFIGDWERAEAQGAFEPVFHAGQGEDVPCTLKPRSRANCERRYNKRVKRAIKKAAEGGKEDPRYIRHIALYKAKLTAKQARKAPQTWASALFVRAKKGGQHANQEG